MPLSLKTDHGPQFYPEEFSTCLLEHEIEHHTTLWQGANGEVDHQNRSLLKTINIAYVENEKDWQNKLNSSWPAS